jgi:hypothetical protein
VATVFAGNQQHIIGDLITMPLRLSWSATQLGLRVTERLALLPVRVAGHLIEAAWRAPAEPRGAGRAAGPSESVDGAVARRVEPEAIPEPRRTGAAQSPSPRDAAAPEGRRAESPHAPVASPQPKPAAEACPRSRAAAAPAAQPTAPVHVSEEVELVQSFADPGAEDGAGAAVHVEEPWERYAQMGAREIIARLAGASREQLAAVELYEGSHRSRRTVLAAADRQLRLATAASRRPT